MNKRENIVNAALIIFQEKGVEKTKISDIVKHAGVAQGTYYLYFPSKMSVMPAIAEIMVEKLIKTVKETVDKKATFSTQLEQLVKAIFLLTKEYNEIQALIYAGLASTEHIKEWEKVYEPVYNWMSMFLEQAIASEDIRSSIRVKPTSKIIIGLIESAAEQVYLYDNNHDEHSADQQIEVIDFLQYALGVK